MVYYPNRILKGLDPYDAGYKTRNPFTWIQEAFSSTEKDVICISGVDSAVYFVFLATGMFSAMFFHIYFVENIWLCFIFF